MSWIRRLSRIPRLVLADERMLRLENEIRELREQLDLLKSSIEIPAEWIGEFQEWRRQNPVPPQPLITVCIATYNRARLLTERSIPSVLGQTYEHFELIVVGDGCTDDTAELVTAIDDPRVRYVDLPRRDDYPEDPIRRWMVAGTHAMNAGLERARGDFVTHLDDDDEFVADRLERLVAFAKESDADFVWHPFWWEDEQGDWQINEAQEFAFRRVTTSSVFYRSWFTRIGWDVSAHRLREPGDWNRFRRIGFIGPRLARYPEPLLRHYRERSQNR